MPTVPFPIHITIHLWNRAYMTANDLEESFWLNTTFYNHAFRLLQLISYKFVITLCIFQEIGPEDVCST